MYGGVFNEKSVVLQTILLFIIGYGSLKVLLLLYSRTDIDGAPALADAGVIRSLLRRKFSPLSDPKQLLSALEWNVSGKSGEELPFESTSSLRTKTLIIVPYRNRSEQLEEFAPTLTAFLSKQKNSVDFKIIIVEQSGTAKFNRGALINVGFIEGSYLLQLYAANRYVNFDCLVVHDVDLLPIDDENSYDCRRSPTVHAWQMSTAIDMHNWDLPGEAAVGGVGMVTREAANLANGWSNRYYGWGGEDNDFFGRLSIIDKRMRKRSKMQGRYRSLRQGHYRSPGEATNRLRILSIFDHLYQAHEGLPTMQYRLVRRLQRQLYFIVTVELWLTEEPERMEPAKNLTTYHLDWEHLAHWNSSSRCEDRSWRVAEREKWRQACVLSFD